MSAETNRHNRSPDTSIIIRPGDQRNILVVGVDELSAAQPELVSVWLVMYYPQLANVNFVPIYPRTENSSPKSDLAVDLGYKLNHDATLAAEFLSGLRSLGLWWDHYVVLDEQALAQMIHISLAQQPQIAVEHNQVNLRADLDWSSPDSTLLSQMNLITAMCSGISQPTLALDLDAIFTDLSSNLKTDMKPRTIRADLKSIQNAANTITCEFPTIQGEISLVGGQVGYP